MRAGDRNKDGETGERIGTDKQKKKGDKYKESKGCETDTEKETQTHSERDTVRERHKEKGKKKEMC